ncbi:hypothetical protein TURU_092383 [Turdus rufiventris]|nr:hypothetical protein TURU_092383 [Turdus rufiventris]
MKQQLLRKALTDYSGSMLRKELRIGADLASQLKNQQYHCRIWLNKIPGLAVIIITGATSLRPLLARNQARHSDSD